ncbi:hypothetical protein H2203_004921 [Taxawa tesnikishii (nom. ined.)]|nr:hypothetical protein H2203_004921 [Dothideales sp. JES 119]
MERRSSYQVTEPHPSVPRSSYIHAGRGGAGNYKRYNSSELTKGPEATGPASLAILSPPPTGSRTMFTSGRGGAGNTFKRSESQRAIFSFDEELEREQRMRENQSKAPVYHIGRGGAGNLVDEMKPRGGRVPSTSSASSNASTSSEASRKLSNAFSRLSRTFSRQ